MSTLNHQHAAEQLLRTLNELASSGAVDAATAKGMEITVAQAQAHATLAVAQRLAELSDVFETRSIAIDVVRR